MEQAATLADDAGEMVVEHLRVQFAGNAEARRVVQDRIDAVAGDLFDLLRHVTVAEVQATASGG
ncbi:hypothetical protein D3C72_2118170 [compost metagenome]